MKNQKTWMAISGATGFAFFLIANFTDIFVGLSLVAGLLQLAVNTFVFLVWRKAYVQEAHWNFTKFVAFWGVVVPVVMASITLWRVLIPMLTGVL